MTDIRRPDPAYVRREAIRGLLADGRFQRTTDLAARFGVTVVTIRSDLEDLESAGAVQRVRGGAVGHGDRREASFEHTQLEASDAKERIGAACAAMVESGQSVLIDAGTTATAVAVALAARTDLADITVVTNNLMAVLLIRDAPHVTIVVSGGTFRREQHSLVDPLGWPVLDRVRGDIAFVGCTGISVEHGVTNVNLPEAEMKLRMISASRRRVIVADSRKIGQTSTALVCLVSDIDTLVTEAPDHPEVEPLRAAGVEVVLA